MKHIRKQFVLLTTIFVPFVFKISRPAEPPTLIQAVPLSALREGDFDRFAVDLTGHRLFLTADQGVVEVFDPRTNKFIQTLTDLKEPHSIVYRADIKR